jgi:hypothetical protein
MCGLTTGNVIQLDPRVYTTSVIIRLLNGCCSMYTCEPTHILLENTFSTIQSNIIKFIEAVYRLRTDNALANRKRTKGQTTIYKTLHTKENRAIEIRNC